MTIFRRSADPLLTNGAIRKVCVQAVIDEVGQSAANADNFPRSSPVAKFVFALAFVLAFAIAEKALAGPSFCTTGHDGVPSCFDDAYFDGPA